MNKLKYLNDKVIKKALAHENKAIRNYVARLISDTTHIPYEDLEGKLELVYPEISVSGDVVNSEVDLVFKEGNVYFNIEINYGNSKTLRTKNAMYTFQLALRDIKNAKMYREKNKIYQININAFDPYGYGELVYEAQMMVKGYDIVHNDIITTYEINLAYFEKVSYNKIRKESLLYDLALLVIEDKKVLGKLYGEDVVMERVQKEMDNYMKALDEILFYDPKELQKQIEEEMRETGFNDGFKDGEKKSKLEIAKKMLQMTGITKEQVYEATGLSTEEIENLK